MSATATTPAAKRAASAELAADVQAFLARGGAVQHIADGVSGLNAQGMPAVDGKRGINLTRPENLANTSAEHRARMAAARSRPRGGKPRISGARLAAVIHLAAQMTVPIRRNARRYAADRAEETARRRIAVVALKEIGAPAAQIGAAFGISGKSAGQLARQATDLERQYAMDLLREIKA